ncbi:hypothetical protein FGO68_gene3009 [Halteria grandinella]|uniref:Transmembrane protein n=1 Tax=Halteria grandinella TaxID=5974 RepID=A0A8J8NP43_HALGN|nr:hypothetical protein FGO68_gene3009 [Halteria grandinella]
MMKGLSLSLIQYSLGIYRPMLYYKGQSRYGSLLSVIFSFVFGLIFLIGTLAILLDIFRKAHYNKNQKVVKFSEVPELADLNLPEAVDIMKLQFLISINGTLPKANCSDFFLLISQVQFEETDVEPQTLIAMPFNNSMLSGKDSNLTMFDCEANPSGYPLFQDYLKNNASDDLALYFSEENFTKIPCLDLLFGIASFQTEVEMTSFKIGFHTKSLLEGGLVVGDDIIKQVVPQQGKFTSKEFLYVFWQMEFSELSTSTGIMGETLSFMGLGNAFQKIFYMASDEIEHYQWSIDTEKFPDSHMLIMSAFCFKTRVLQTAAAPDSIFKGLAQIGGLLGLMRLFRFLSNYQERKFERELQQDLDIKKDDEIKVESQERLLAIQTDSRIKEEGGDEGEKIINIKDFYSYETFKAMHESIQEMKAKILELETKVKSLEGNK